MRRTDLFAVTLQAGYADWHNTGAVIDCKSTNSCGLTEIKTEATCTVGTSHIPAITY